MSVQNFMAINPIAIEIFQSGRKWWIDQPPNRQTMPSLTPISHLHGYLTFLNTCYSFLDFQCFLHFLLIDIHIIATEMNENQSLPGTAIQNL